MGTAPATGQREPPPDAAPGRDGRVGCRWGQGFPGEAAPRGLLGGAMTLTRTRRGLRGPDTFQCWRHLERSLSGRSAGGAPQWPYCVRALSLWVCVQTPCPCCQDGSARTVCSREQGGLSSVQTPWSELTEPSGECSPRVCRAGEGLAQPWGPGDLGSGHLRQHQPGGAPGSHSCPGPAPPCPGHRLDAWPVPTVSGGSRLAPARPARGDSGGLSRTAASPASSAGGRCKLSTPGSRSPSSCVRLGCTEST